MAHHHHHHLSPHHHHQYQHHHYVRPRQGSGVSDFLKRKIKRLALFTLCRSSNSCCTNNTSATQAILFNIDISHDIRFVELFTLL